jgi:hypothetical protein
LPRNPRCPPLKRAQDFGAVPVEPRLERLLDGVLDQEWDADLVPNPVFPGLAHAFRGAVFSLLHLRHGMAFLLVWVWVRQCANACANHWRATGAIGHVCAELLAGEAARVLLVARDEKKLEILRDRLKVEARSELVVSTKMDILKEAQLILTVTSSIHDVIHPGHLQPGSVVCDVARPRDVSAMVAAVRNDILVIDGGMVDIPGAVNFNFNFGFPEGKAYACMAETIALALEGRFEDYTVGKDITLERVKDITEIAARHGFRMSGFRSFEREVTHEQIEAVRQNARKGLRRA